MLICVSVILLTKFNQCCHVNRRRPVHNGNGSGSNGVTGLFVTSNNMYPITPNTSVTPTIHTLYKSDNQIEDRNTMVKPNPWQILKHTTADSRLVVDVIRISEKEK